MFSGDNEDGDFLSPAGGAKLASLFGLDQEASQGNESFQYTAPKQPRKNSNPAPTLQKAAHPPGAPAVLFATAVQAFRYINGQYMNQGKLGAAILGNHTTKEYKLLLYLSQQKQVTAAKIHVGFVFTVQPNSYYTFYDDQRQNWSLKFESEKASSDFCKEVCLAKANGPPSLETVVVQDLCLGEGQGVETGDSLEVVYTGWLLQNHTIGQMFDSNQNKDKLLRLKLGAGKVIKGWEEGMQGMKKAGRRLIIIPPTLAYGSKGVPNRVPPNSTLIFEADLRRVKFLKDNGSDRGSNKDSAAPSPTPSPAPSVESLAPEPPAQPTPSGPDRPGEPLLRAKSNSLNEQLVHPDATKAKLISRMAKMGQPLLPFLTGVTSQPESSDSELEDTSSSRLKDHASVLSPVPITTAASGSSLHPHTVPAPSALLPVMSTVPPQHGLSATGHAFQPYSYNQTSATTSQLQPVGQVFPAQTVSYMGSSDVTSFLMTEARQHNTEIRLSVAKVGDKVDQLASKIDDLQRHGNQSMGMSTISMETSMIMQSIQRIIQENECLKKEVFEKSSRIEEQNHKIGELINQNQRYMEQSHLLLEQRHDSLKSSSEQNQTRLLQAEQDKVRLTEDLAASTARLSQLQLEASAQQQKAVELQTKLNSALQDNENHGQKVTTLQTQLEELKEEAERYQAQYRTEKQKRKELELRVNNMEEELQDLKTDKETLERTLSDRKKKWQAERQRRDEELEEMRRSTHQDLDNLRSQLRKARTSNDNAASEQLSQLQAELEEEWKRKCEQAVTLAKQQHSRELSELTEQRDALQDTLSKLQEKFSLLKQSKESEEQNLLHHQGQAEELHALQKKYTALEQQAAAVHEKLQRRVAELEQKQEEKESSPDTATEVKRVMNGVFHSLRGEFDRTVSYSGQAVLDVIVTTIKNVTLQLLSGSERPSASSSKKDEDEESEEATDQEKTQATVHVNGEREVEEEEQEVVHEEQEVVHEEQEVVHEEQQVVHEEQQVVHEEQQVVHEEQQVVHEEKQVVHETEKEEEAKSESQQCDKFQGHDKVSQEEASEAETEAHSAKCTESSKSTPAEAESEVQPGKEVCPAPVVGTEEPNPVRPSDIDDEPNQSSPTEVLIETATTENDLAKTELEKANEEETNPTKTFGPPTNPPPPPNPPQDSPDEDTILTERMDAENGEEPFFETPAKPPAPPSEEDDEDELSLKGRPPPAPLFGDDEDDDDLDWLN